MTVVALVGADGSGKTTVAKCLERSEQLRVKYLYMGLSTKSSNFSLPTSRLVLFFKQRAYRKNIQRLHKDQPEDIPARELEYKEAKRGLVWITFRLLNRMAEACYRQFISTWYQIRGYLVLYDRYLLFDTVPEPVDSPTRNPEDSVIYWILDHWFQKPDLIIFLDAPAEVLFKRKQDASPDDLNKMRRIYLEQGKKMAHFVRIDTTQSPDKVLEEVTRQITEIRSGKSTTMLIGDHR